MKFATVDDWLSWLETLHPSAIELGLERINRVAQRLAVKHFSCPVVVIAGTNGKGSCVALLESIALAHGYNVGCYTSPHLVSFNERIRFNAHPVADPQLLQVFSHVDKARGETSLTYFEFSTLAALLLFKQADQQQQLDLLVLEVGLGGRLDAVNIVDHDLAIITSIDYDHTQWLGETREEIGREKAGIFRSNGVAIIGEPEIPQSVKQLAGEKNTRLLCNGVDYSLTVAVQNSTGSATQESAASHWQGIKARFGKDQSAHSENISLNLTPLANSNRLTAIQSLAADNIATALQAIYQLPLQVTEQNILNGIENVQIAGRFEIIPGEPSTVLDVAHNPAAAILSARKYVDTMHSGSNLGGGQGGRLHVVVGLLDDKDYPGVLSPFFGIADTWYPCNVPSIRSGAAETLYNYLIDSGCRVSGKYLHPKVAYNQAVANANYGDFILVYGSFYTVAAIKAGLMAKGGL